MQKVCITTLGCDKNTCDSEQLAAELRAKGHILVATDADADVIIINTCSFIESARREAIKVIKSKFKYKPRAKIVVTGCATVKHRNIIPDGVDEIWEISKSQTVPKLLSTPRSYAYIKIADGCDNQCAYCTIPSIRGGYVSRPKQDIIDEVTHFANLGVKEFILVAQDLTKYSSIGNQYNLSGQKHSGQTSGLTNLLQSISRVRGVQRIRLHYVYPSGITDDLIDEVAKNPKVCKYLDIPFQHVSRRIVELMNRKGSSEEYTALIEKLRNRIPGIAIRSTFMVGFPTETDEEFAELCNFMKINQLDFVGFFAYSREAGTRAYAMSQISAKTKNMRLRAIQAVQRDVLLHKDKKLIGKTVKVICDFHDSMIGYSIARTQYQSPEVDPCVIIHEPMQPGQEYTVRITDTQEENLIGVLLKEKTK